MLSMKDVEGDAEVYIAPHQSPHLRNRCRHRGLFYVVPRRLSSDLCWSMEIYSVFNKQNDKAHMVFTRHVVKALALIVS